MFFPFEERVEGKKNPLPKGERVWVRGTLT